MSATLPFGHATQPAILLNVGCLLQAAAVVAIDKKPSAAKKGNVNPVQIALFGLIKSVCPEYHATLSYLP